MKFYLFPFLTILLFSGCCKKLTPTIDHNRQDSIHIETRTEYVDSLVFLPADSAVIMAMVICPPSGKPILKPITGHGKKTHVTAEIKDGQLRVECNCDSTEVKLQNQIRTNSIYKSEIDRLRELVPEKYIPKFIKFLAWTGGIVLLFLFVYGLYKLYRVLKHYHLIQ